MSDLSAKVIADLKRELAEAKAAADAVTESMGSEIMRLHGEIEQQRTEITSLRGILSTWLEWGGHCSGCEFVRQRANNPGLD